MTNGMFGMAGMRTLDVTLLRSPDFGQLRHSHLPSVRQCTILLVTVLVNEEKKDWIRGPRVYVVTIGPLNIPLFVHASCEWIVLFTNMLWSNLLSNCHLGNQPEGSSLAHITFSFVFHLNTIQFKFARCIKDANKWHSPAWITLVTCFLTSP